jgi:hypothetical protein
MDHISLVNNEKHKLLIAGLVVAGVVVFLLYYQKMPEFSFDPDREVIFVVKGTYLRTKRMELKSFNNKWFVIDPKYGIPVEIATPYSMRFNDNYEVVLESNGTLAMVSNDHLERSELRWIDDRWRHKDPSTTEWLEFGDPEPPDPEE